MPTLFTRITSWFHKSLKPVSSVVTPAVKPVHPARMTFDDDVIQSAWKDIVGVCPPDATPFIPTPTNTTVLRYDNMRGNTRQRNPRVSAYNPSGDKDNPCPQLSRLTYFCGVCMNEMVNQLTREEIDGFNAIKSDCDARSGEWTATIRRWGSRNELHVVVPTDPDRRAALPPLRDVLYELRTGKAPQKVCA